MVNDGSMMVIPRGYGYQTVSESLTLFNIANTMRFVAPVNSQGAPRSRSWPWLGSCSPSMRGPQSRETLMKQLPFKELVKDGVLAGLFAGLIFVVIQMIVGSAQAPWRMFASIPITQRAFTEPFNFGLFLVGFVVHFLLCVIYGAVFGGLSRILPDSIHRSFIAMSAIGMMFGLVLWVVNFPIFSKLFFPWLLQARPLAQILIHILAFGFPLGAGLWGFEQSRRQKVLREATV